MEQLLFFIIWAVFILAMMRFGCGAHVMGHRHSSGSGPGQTGKGDSAELRWVPPPKDIDPVCGKTVMTDKAKPSVHAGHVCYFCSRECREIFEAAPDLYLGGGKSKHPRLERFHA